MREASGNGIISACAVVYQIIAIKMVLKEYEFTLNAVMHDFSKIVMLILFWLMMIIITMILIIITMILIIIIYNNNNNNNL